MRNRLIQLLADNRQVADRRFEVRASADNDEAEILLYDAIVDSELEAEWWGGVAPEPFVKAVRAITASTIRVRINSPGGSVFAARAMETALREHPAKVIVHIDALAASAASFLAMAGDEIVMSKGAMMMIHKAWTWAWGNADDLVQTAALLEKIDSTLVDTYADRTGQAGEAIAGWMAAETWFTAQEAVDKKFADRIAEPVAAKAQASAHWNLRAYTHAPAAFTRAPASRQANEPAHATADHRGRQQQRLKLLDRIAIA